MTELTVLRTVALKGRVTPDLVADTTGLPTDEVAAAASAAVESGRLKDTPNGLRMTPDGRARLQELLADERATIDQSGIAALYEEFNELNSAAKSIFTAWQVRDGEPNDHTDADYDEEVLGRLTAVHEKMAPLVERVAALAPRAGRYGQRLAEAQAKYAGGDHTFVTKPIIDSYHTVWFELHEDLISWAGLTRADEAAAGRAH
ncbi:MAG: pyruvate, phosphate dikinase [Aeromicrobium sp.]|nr:pyruvate, phosphate dikinase [Aeromicrobium sp.]